MGDSGTSGGGDDETCPPRKKAKYNNDDVDNQGQKDLAKTSGTNVVHLVGQMHSSVDVEPEPQEIFLELGLLIQEGRKHTATSPKGFEEGPHCLKHLQKVPRNHVCSAENHLCAREESFRKHVELLWRNNVPLCIEVLLASDCPCGRDKTMSPEISPLSDPSFVLLEQWTITPVAKRGGMLMMSGPADLAMPGGSGGVGGGLAVGQGQGGGCGMDGRGSTNGRSILHVVRSFLHFSQLSAWLALSKGESPKNIMYRVTIPGENFVSKFHTIPEDHEFPTVQFKSHVMKVSVKSLPRAYCATLGSVPSTHCSNVICTTRSQIKRSQSPPVGEIIRGGSSGSPRPRPAMGMMPPGLMYRYRQSNNKGGGSPFGAFLVESGGGGSNDNRAKQRQLRKEQREKIIFHKDTVASSSSSSTSTSTTRQSLLLSLPSSSTIISNCDKGVGVNASSSSSDCSVSTGSDYQFIRYPKFKNDNLKGLLMSTMDSDEVPSSVVEQRDEEEDDGGDDEEEEEVVKGQEGLGFIRSNNISNHDAIIARTSRIRQIPSLNEKIDFLKSLDTVASRLFHRKTGLPLTSSPAPLRKGQDRFDFDSSLVTGSRITSRFRRGCHPLRFSEPTRALLGSFEESVLNGRIEPVSTVQGFTAEIGASGSFCPSHVHLPVTVFFYTFCDNDKISTPYLAHVDLGDQGYCVPRKGTVQVTLFNPLRTVIKMFVVQFNLENMPNNSQTFLRQRTYFMPLGETQNPESSSNPNARKWLRYLIHLRFTSNHSGQIFLDKDIRMVIFRKSDADTHLGFDVQTPHELRSFTSSPHNPQFSPRINTNTSEVLQVDGGYQQLASKNAILMPYLLNPQRKNDESPLTTDVRRRNRSSVARKLSFDSTAGSPPASSSSPSSSVANVGSTSTTKHHHHYHHDHDYDHEYEQVDDEEESTSGDEGEDYEYDFDRCNKSRAGIEMLV